MLELDNNENELTIKLDNNENDITINGLDVPYYITNKIYSKEAIFGPADDKEPDNFTDDEWQEFSKELELKDVNMVFDVDLYNLGTSGYTTI